MKLTIIGASGHGKVAADVAEKIGYDEIEFLDNNAALTSCGKWPVVGTPENAAIEGPFFVAIGNAAAREKVTQRFPDREIVTLIHPSAVVADGVRIGAGSILMAGAIVNPGASIGAGCIINTAASVDHDCVLEDYVHVSVGAHLSGTVHVGKSTWIGVGAAVVNNVNICGESLIGAGAVVIRDIETPGTYVGVPARRMK